MVINEKEFVEHLDSDLAKMDAAKAQHAVEPMTLDATVAKLAATPLTEYELVRRSEAKRFNIRVSVLEKLVEAARKMAGATTSATAAESLAPLPPEPWPEPVEGASLLNDLLRFIERFVIVDVHARCAIALWIAFTYFFEIAETSPRLHIVSPEKRCGKTRLLELLLLLCPRPLSTANLSPSALFRIIELERCALLIDEADSFLRGNEDMRNLINSGHTPEYAFVIRNVPLGERDWQPKRFSTWCPMAMASIKKLADTIEDRSIRIAMRRKLKAERVERLTRRSPARVEAAALASKLARFAADNLENLRDAKPLAPDALNDRAVDNWEHLLSIADLAGGGWPERARTAAVGLSGEREASDAAGWGEMLIADIRGIFDQHAEPSIRSSELVAALVGMAQRPWPEVSRGRPMTTARLARMLKDFGVRPKEDAAGSKYTRTDFEDVFTRYAPIPADQTAIVPQTLGAVRRNDDLQVPRSGTLKSEETPTETRGSGTMADANGGSRAQREISPVEGDEINRLTRADSLADEAGLELYPDDGAPLPEDNSPLPTVEDLRSGPDAFVLRRVRRVPTDDKERDS